MAKSTEFPLSTMRHSAAHILAQALRERYPDASLAIGPDTEHGFFYDVKVDPPLRSEDLPDLEKRMKKIVKMSQRFERFHLPMDEGIKQLEAQGQLYKAEMARELKKKGETELSFYRNVRPGKENAEKSALFIDMCNGPHVEHTGQIGVFKLASVSGAYWKGRTDEPQLQRISGYLFKTEEELKAYEFMVEEAKKRDHRRLGVDLELFTTSEKIGPGLILWLPRGNLIKEELETWAKATEAQHGYQRVTTPVITKEDLFYTSEHLPHYKESMFPPMRVDDENYYIKPMNCPFHHTIFSMRPRSYRELPLRFAEYGLCHRYEDSGSLMGLMRVRAMEMNDAHIYCSEEDAVSEFLNVLKLHEYYYKTLGIEKYHMVLALRNPENTKYHGDEKMWKRAEALTREAMETSGINYTVEEDGAAFYGPKVDFQIVSSIGREFTASTCQLDLFMPEKFDLKFIDRDGTTRRPACLHRSPLGTHERFVGFLIEHFAGAFPLWLAPEQIRILPVSENVWGYCREMETTLRQAGFRVMVDDSNETLGKRIRNAEKLKVPRMVVIGDQEKDRGVLNWRDYFSGQKFEVDLTSFIAEAREELASKRIRPMAKPQPAS
ncbi:MAG: threonine--tRNA ligase [Leptospirales bacterium]|nr:threonine--tRNA ligase [Leptospirales bacterium]